MNPEEPYSLLGPRSGTWRHRVEESFESVKTDSELIKSGLCGETVDDYERAMKILTDRMAEWLRLG